MSLFVVWVFFRLLVQEYLFLFEAVSISLPQIFNLKIDFFNREAKNTTEMSTDCFPYFFSATGLLQNSSESFWFVKHRWKHFSGNAEHFTNNMNKDFTGEDFLAAEEKCLWILLFLLLLHLLYTAAVHTEWKGAGTEAGIISPSLMILEAERCGVSSTRLLLLWKNTKGETSATYKKGVFCIVILFGNLSVFFTALTSTTLKLGKGGLFVFWQSVAYQKHEIAILKWHLKKLFILIHPLKYSSFKVPCLGMDYLCFCTETSPSWTFGDKMKHVWIKAAPVSPGKVLSLQATGRN